MQVEVRISNFRWERDVSRQTERWAAAAVVYVCVRRLRRQRVRRGRLGWASSPAPPTTPRFSPYAARSLHTRCPAGPAARVGQNLMMRCAETVPSVASNLVRPGWGAGKCWEVLGGAG